MKTQISRNLERCSEIADQLQDSSFIKTRDGWQENTEVFTLAQELERLIEDLFVMTGAEAAREVLIDQQLLDAGRDPNAGIERALDMIMEMPQDADRERESRKADAIDRAIMDQPTARDEMPETMEELADREEPDMQSTIREMTNSSDIIADTVKHLENVYRVAMMQGERMSLSPEQSLRAQQHPSMRKKR